MIKGHIRHEIISKSPNACQDQNRFGGLVIREEVWRKEGKGRETQRNVKGNQMREIICSHCKLFFQLTRGSGCICTDRRYFHVFNLFCIHCHINEVLKLAI